MIGKQFDLREITINFKAIKTKLNELYEEGKRAMRDGDFKEDPDLVTEIQSHSCDVCEANADEIRFICLHCRNLQLCQTCHGIEAPYQHRLRLDKTQKREHQHWHIFLRVFDYQAVSLSQETEKLTEEDTSLNSKKKLEKMMKQKFGIS